MATLTTSWQSIASYTWNQTASVTFYLDAKYSTQSIANNTTTIQTRLRSVLNSGGISGAGYNYTCSYASTVSGSGTWVFATETITSGESTITHNSDGTKSLSLSASMKNNYWGLNKTISTTVSLPTIPRQATITSAQDFNDEGNPTITYNNPLGSNASSLQICLINPSDTIRFADYRDVNKTGTLSYTFNFTDEERNALRQACTGTSMQVKFVLRTIIGGNGYYSSATKTMTIVNGNPTLSYEVVETDASVISTLGTNQLLIKGVTKPKVTITATPKKYATISKYTMDLNGNYVESNEYTFNALTGNNLTISATDSRGLKTQQNETLSVIDYFRPYATINVPRAEENDDRAYINIDGTWYNEGFGNTNNQLTITWGYRETDTEIWTIGGTITPTISGNTFTVENELLGNNFSYAKEYKIRVIITDLFSTRSYITTRQKNDYSLKDTYYESDILTYEDMGEIEEYIYQTYLLLNKQMGTSYSYTRQTWYKSSALLVPKLNHIEDGIKNLGQYYYRPEGWQATKLWNTTKPEKFDYTDVNRWINDLNLITERLYNESNSLFPSDTLYPSETLLPH